MNQTQEVILYRNPMEKAFWDTVMNFDNTFPIMAGCITMVGCVFLMNHISDKIKSRNVKRLFQNSILYVSACVSVLVTWKLWI